MTTWPLDFGPCFVFQKDEPLRTPLLGTSVDRDKREPKPQTRPAPVPLMGRWVSCTTCARAEGTLHCSHL